MRALACKCSLALANALSANISPSTKQISTTTTTVYKWLIRTRRMRLPPWSFTRIGKLWLPDKFRKSLNVSVKMPRKPNLKRDSTVQVKKANLEWSQSNSWKIVRSENRCRAHLSPPHVIRGPKLLKIRRNRHHAPSTLPVSNSWIPTPRSPKFLRKKS